MKQVCVREISILNVKPLIIFIFRGLFFGWIWLFNYLYRYSTVFSYFQLAFLDVIVKIGIGDLSTDSKALYIIIIMFKEILIGYCQPMKSIPMLCFGPGSHGLACDI